MAAKLNRIDMTQGPLFPQIVRFSLPVAGASMLQLLFNAADTIVVGKFAGSNCMAAVGATGSLIGMLVLASGSIAIGTNILIARYLGARQEDKVSGTAHNSILLGLLLGIIITTVGYLFSEDMLQWLNTPETLMPLAVKYLKIYFLSVPANLVYNFGAAIMRANGDTRRPMFYLITSGVVNVVLNVVSVVIFHMDVAGVAIATVVSQYVSLILLLSFLFRCEGCCKLELRKMVPDFKLIWDIFIMGLPDCIQTVLYCFANFSLARAINSFGEGYVAANTAFANIEAFVGAATAVGSTAAITFISQNYGAKKPDRILRSLGCTLATFVGVGLVMGIGIYLLGKPLLGVYVSRTDPNYDIVISEGMLRMKCVMLFEFLDGYLMVPTGAVRGLGKKWTPMIVTLLGTCVFRIVWIEALFPLVRQSYMLYLIYPITWFITGSSHLISFFATFRRIRPQMLAEAAAET